MLKVPHPEVRQPTFDIKKIVESLIGFEEAMEKNKREFIKKYNKEYYAKRYERII